MLRPFRPDDAPTYVRFLKQHFPEEEVLLGTDPVVMERVVRRLFRWDLRLLLALARALGRPIARFYVIEVDGTVAATTLLTFTRRTGFLSGIVVDTPYRRRGFARRLLARAQEDARRAGRRFIALDVLRSNAPARALYDAAGYRPLRTYSVLRSRLPAASPVAAAAAEPGLRPFRPEDALPLSEIASRALPPSVAEVLPVERSSFRLPPPLLRVLGSESDAWVLDEGGRAVGFLRATVSDAMASTNLTAPLLDPGVPDGRARGLVRHAVGWIRSRSPGHIAVEVPDHDPRAARLLAEEGFETAYVVDTLYRTVHA